MDALTQSFNQLTLKLPEIAFIKTHGCEGALLTPPQKALIDRHLSIITLVHPGEKCYVGTTPLFDKALGRFLERLSEDVTPTILWAPAARGDDARRQLSEWIKDFFSPEWGLPVISFNVNLLDPTVQWHFTNKHFPDSFKPTFMMYDTTSNQTIDDSWHDGTRIMPPTFTLYDLAMNMKRYGRLYPPNAPMVPPAGGGGDADDGTPARAYLIMFSCRIPCEVDPASWRRPPGSGQHIKKRNGGSRAGKRRRVKRRESRRRKGKRKRRTHRRRRRRRRRRRQRKTRRRRRC